MATQQVNTTNYFPHDANARHDEKIIHLRMRHGAAGYGVYFMVLERLREENNYMSAKDYNMIAFDLRVDAAMVKSVVEDFGLFVFTDDGKYFYSDSFNRRMNTNDAAGKTRSEIGKAAAQKRWSKTKKQDVPCETEPPEETPAPPPAPTAQSGRGTDNQARLKRFFGKANQAGIETLMMRFGLKPDDMPTLREVANEVIAEWELQERVHLDYTDWSQHLISLMRVRFDERQRKNPEPETKPAPPPSYEFNGGFGGQDI